MKRSLTLLCVVACIAVGSCDGDAPAADPTVQAPSFAEIDDLARQRKWSEVIRRLEEMRASGSNDAATIRRLAEAHVANGDPAKAIVRLREALAARPDDAALVIALAQQYLRLEETAQARDLLQEARTRGMTSSVDIELALGSALGRMDDFEGAGAAFERAKALGAADSTVQYNQALLFMAKKRYEEARAIFEALLAKEPGRAAVQRELARTLLAISPEEVSAVNRALDLCVAAREKLPDDWRVHEVMGDAWLLLGDFDASLQAYTEALRLGRNPASVEDRYREAVKQQRAAKAKAAESADSKPR